MGFDDLLYNEENDRTFDTLLKADAQENNKPPEKPSEPEPEGFLDYAADIGRGALNGGIDFVESVGNLLPEVANGVKWMFADEDDEEDDDYYFKKLHLPHLKRSQTFIGKMTNEIAQFAIGFFVSGGVLNAASKASMMATGGANMFSKIIQAGKLGKDAIQGGLADFISFDGAEERLANLIESVPSLANPITEWLAADPDDGINGRLKNVIEGFGLGAATGLLTGGLKMLKGKQLIEAGEAAGDTLLKETGEKFAKEGLEESADSAMKVGLDESGEVTGTVGEFMGKVDVENPPTFLNEEGKVTHEFGQYVIDLINSGEDISKIRVDGLNTKTFGTTEDVTLAMEAVQNAILKSLNGQPLKREVSFKIIEKQALMLSMNKPLVRRALQNMSDTALNGLTAKVTAGRIVANEQASELAELCARVTEGTMNVSDVALLKPLERFVDHWQNVIDVTGEIGRALNSMKIGTHKLMNKKTMERYIDLVNYLRKGRDVKAKLKKMAPVLAACKDDPEMLMRVLTESRWDKAMRIGQEWRINAMLSSARGLAVDIMSTATNTFLKPMERMIGGVLTGNREALTQGKFMYDWYRKALFDNLRIQKLMVDVPESAADLAKKAFGDGVGSTLDPSHSVIDQSTMKAISSQTVGWNPESLIGQSIDYFGKIWRTPGRLRTSSDEMFKAINAHAYLYAEGMQKGMDKQFTGEALQEFVTKHIKDGFDPETGKLINEGSLNWAREATFTSELSGFNKSLQDMVNKHPALRVVMPFVRTPLNIVDGVIQRTPGLQHLSANFRKALESGDPIKMADARGRQATGVALYSAAAMLAADGKITGKGPANWREKRQMLEAGWQPYSLVVTDAEGNKQYISYNRLDPFGMFFGLAADIALLSGENEEQELAEVTTHALNALAMNLTSKTYLRGLSDAITALNEPDTSARVISSFIGSHIPVLVKDLGRHSPIPGVQMPWLDEAQRDIRDMTDALLAKLPGMSQGLAPRRNILGDVMEIKEGFGPDILSPFAYSKEVDDDVLQELADLQHGFARPRKAIGQVDLTQFKNANGQDAYDRMLELNGQVKINGMTLKDTLGKLIKSEQYKATPNLRVDGVDNPRVKLIEKILSRYRVEAMGTMRSEFKDLDKALYYQRYKKQAANSSNFQELLGQ